MRAVVRVTALVTAAVAAWWTAGACSSAVAAGTTDVCSLLTRAEVERITGRRQYRDPDAAELAGGSVCGYSEAEVMLFSGEGSGERLEAMLRSFGHDKDERHPVSGVGDGAYVIYPEPR